MNHAELLSGFTIGLMGSTHCIAMCGGIGAALNFGMDQSGIHRLLRLLGFHLGRILSYAVIALTLGTLMNLAAGPSGALSLFMRISAGLLLIAMGLYIANIWTGLTRLEQVGAPLWAKLQPAVKRLLPVKSFAGALALGALWGWLPCGLVYSSLAWAVSADHAAESALRMLFFGLGTLPAMLSISVAADAGVRWLQRGQTRRIAGLLLIIYGAWTLVTPLQRLLQAPEMEGHTHQHHATP